MKIILHILAKDLRRQWIEVSLFVLACAAWVWQTARPSVWEWLQQREFLPILVFGLWLIVVIRAVQGESLVGDREFWMTRPYAWPQLMTAKGLFLVLCLNGPLFIADVVLLVVARIPLSWPLVPGLLFLGLEFAFFLTLPAAALAAMTQSLVQWGLAIAGMLVYTLMLSWIPWNKLPDGLEGGENLCTSLGMVLIAPALVFILLWQYARRRAWPARLVLGGTQLVIPLIILLATSSFIRSIAYPQAKGSPPFELALAQDNSDPVQTYSRSDGYDGADLSIPVSATPPDSDTVVNVDGFRITLTAENGWRWQSPWLNRSIQFSRNDENGKLNFSMSADQADQMAKLHANATVELAFAVYRLGALHRVDTTADRFQLADRTYCSWRRVETRYLLITGLDCEAALHVPPILEIELDSGSNTCANPEGPLPAGHFANEIEYGSDLPADFDPNPAHKLNLNFGAWIPPIPDPREPKDNLQAGPCKGTPFTVRMGTFEGRTRATFNLGSVGVEKKVEDDAEASVPFSPAQE